MKKWRDGTSHIIFQPLELMERLAALVPAPRFNMIRYSGVLAPSAAWRQRIIPEGIESPRVSSVCTEKCGQNARVPGEAVNLAFAVQKRKTENEKDLNPRPRRFAWAELLKRVFSVDALKCNKCGNTMRILCAVNPPDAIRKILDCLGLPSRPPPIAPASIRYELG